MKFRLLILAAGIILVAALSIYYGNTCFGQCATHTRSGKTCQDKCFSKKFCPEADK